MRNRHTSPSQLSSWISSPTTALAVLGRAAAAMSRPRGKDVSGVVAALSVGAVQLDGSDLDRKAQLHGHLLVSATATVAALASLGEGPDGLPDRDELARQLQIAAAALRAADALSPQGSRPDRLHGHGYG
jgi:hypothetical protein